MLSDNFLQIKKLIINTTYGICPKHHLVLYSGIFLLVQIFADLPPNPPEEILVVLIFAVATLSAKPCENFLLYGIKSTNIV